MGQRACSEEGQDGGYGSVGASDPHLLTELLSILRRHPVALMVPAAGLGGVADTLQVVQSPLAVIGVSLAIAVLFECYVAYVERLVIATRARATPIRVSTLTWSAMPIVPALVIASVAAIALPLAASGALVLPGIWLLTRWSLFAPAIARERLGPLGGLGRSNELVRGRFRFAFVTATVPLLAEHGVVHATTHGGRLVFSLPLSMVVAAVAVALVSPVAALSVSLAFDRLASKRGPEAS
jgi:hypothetical protein